MSFTMFGINIWIALRNALRDGEYRHPQGNHDSDFARQEQLDMVAKKVKKRMLAFFRLVKRRQKANSHRGLARVFYRNVRYVRYMYIYHTIDYAQCRIAMDYTHLACSRNAQYACMVIDGGYVRERIRQHVNTIKKVGLNVVRLGILLPSAFFCFLIEEKCFSLALCADDCNDADCNDDGDDNYYYDSARMIVQNTAGCRVLSCTQSSSRSLYLRIGWSIARINYLLRPIVQAIG